MSTGQWISGEVNSMMRGETCYVLLVTGIQLLFAHPENHAEIWLVILFIPRKKFHAKLIILLGSSIKWALNLMV